MFRVVAATLFMGAFLCAPAPQELRTDVLDKLKSATVYVKVEDRGREGTGSGFLFLKRGSNSYIMTCEHVVDDAAKVKVVFWSGTPRETVLDAAVVATDPRRDLACLVLKDATGLPAPLELGRKTQVKETETVYAAGFPFGARLASGNKNPEISVSKSSVASIRRNASAEVNSVQISGDVNPGNSGGPFVAADGHVIGVTAVKIMGTQTAFAVPSEEIQAFLQGAVKGTEFRKVGGEGKTGKYEITIKLIDPLTQLKSAGIAYIDEKEVKAETTPEKDGSWKKIHASMKTVEFKIDQYRAVGTLEFTLNEGAKNPAIIFQSYCIRADGTTVWNEPSTQDIAVGPGADPVKDPERAKNPTPEPDLDDPEPLPASEPASGPVVELTLPDAVPFAAELAVNSAFGGLILAPDGSALYALDLSEGQVYKLDPDSLEIKAKLAVHPSAVAMTLTPDGKTLYIGGRRPTVTVWDSRRELPGPNGTLQAITASSFTTAVAMELKGAVQELVATDAGLVIATCHAELGGLDVIDVAKKSEEFVARVRGGGSIRLTRDQRRVYVGDNSRFRCVFLRKQKGEFPTYDSTHRGSHPLGGPLDLTPDDRYLIGGYGSVLRLGKTRDGDLKFQTKIDHFQCLAMASGCGTLFTVSADGFLKAYGLGDFELQKSVKLTRRCERAALDVKRRRLYGVFVETPENRFFDPRQIRLGRICSIGLDGK